MAFDGTLKFDTAIDKTGFKIGLDGLGDIAKKSMDAIGGALSGLASGALDALNQLTGWNGFESIVTDALDVGMAFENSMSNVASLQYAAGATEAQIKSLKDAAEQFGATTQFSMSECADALGYMALAGWDAEKSISALPGVLNLSAASGMGLAQASDMVTDYMSAFSKSVSDYTGEALTAAEFSDKLAFAQANSNTNVQMLGDAFKNCAANMNASGQQMDTVVSILGALANQGLKGSEAGTALSAVMRDINNKMEDGAISINGTTIAIADANGNYRDMIDIMADIEKATAGMGDTQKAAALSAVFTADSIKGMNLVLNAGTDSIRDFESKLSHCEGSAEEMAKVLNDNLEGDVKSLSSAMDAVKNALYEGLEPAFRAIVQTITNNVAPALLDLTKGFFDMLNGIPEAENKVKSSLDSLLNWLTDSAKSVLPNILSTVVDGITKGIPDIVTGVTKIVDAVFDVVNSLDILSVIQNGIKNIGDTVSHSNVIFRQATENMISGLIEALPKMIDSAGDIVDALQKAISNHLRSLKNQGKLLIENVISGVVEALPALQTALSEMFQSSDSGVFGQFVETGASLIQALVTGITSNSEKFLAFASTLIHGLITNFTKNGTALLNAGMSLIDNFIDIFNSVDVSETAKLAENIVSGIVKHLSMSIQIFAQTGAELIQKFCEGFVSGIGALLQTAGSIGEVLVNAVSVLVPALLDAGAMLFDAFLTGISDNLPDLLEVAESVVMSLVNSIISALPQLFTACIETAEAIVESIMNTVPDLLQVGAEIIFQLAAGIVGALPQLLEMAVNLLADFMGVLMNSIPELLQIGAEIVLNLVNGIVNALPQLLGMVVSLITDAVGLLMDNLSGLVQIGAEIVVQLVSGIVKTLPKLFKTITVMTSKLLSSLMNFLPELIQVGLDIVNVLLAGIMENLPLLISSAVTLISDFVKMVLENIPLLLDAGFQILQGLLTAIMENLPLLVECAVSLVMQLVTAILENLPLLIDCALQLVDMFVNFIIENLEPLLDCAFRIIEVLINGLLSNLPQIVEMSVQIIEKLAEGLLSKLDLILQSALRIVHMLVEFLSNHAKDFISIGIQILTMLIQGLGEMLPELIAEGLFLATQFLEKIKNQDWNQLGKDIISFLLQGIKGMYDLAVEGTTELIDKIWTTITDINWGELGGNILQGIVDGLSNIGNKLTEWGEGFVGGIADFFGIHSPSRLMRDEIGKYLGLGIGEGLQDNLPDMEQISSELSSGFKPEFDFPDFDFPDFPQISLIDENALQAFRLQSAKSANLVQSSPTSQVVNNYYQQTTNNTTTNNQKNSQQGDIIIPVYIEGEQIQTAVISAIQLENMRSGGGFI